MKRRGSRCSATSLNVGTSYDKKLVCTDECYYVNIPRQTSALLRFDVAGAVPAGATVVRATAFVRVGSKSASTLRVSAHGVLRPWTNAATWSTSDGQQPWVAARRRRQPRSTSSRSRRPRASTAGT